MKNPDPAVGTWRWVVGAAVFFLLLMVLAGLMTVARALRAPGEAARLIPEPAADKTPAAVVAPEVAAARSRPHEAAAENVLATDSEVICAREDGRRELINNLRQQAAADPDSPAALSAEEIRRLEISGASLM